VVFLLVWLSALAQPQAPQVAPAHESIILVDGLPVELRFAQSLRGMVRRWWPKVEVDSRPGDRIRLVCSEDVKVNGFIVIAKGAIAQATVTDVSLPDPQDPEPETGLAIKVDWVKDVTGQQIPLRALPKGKPGPFILEVRSMKGGLVARPESLKRTMIDALSYKWMFTAWHAWTWAPAGTRITTFVEGNATLESKEVELAQQDLPGRNSDALLTIYRMKGSKDEHPGILCDGKPTAEIGPRQFLTLELAAGSHSCRVDKTTPVQLTLEAGEVRYLHLKSQPISGKWELQTVTAGEGEDSVAKAQH